MMKIAIIYGYNRDQIDIDDQLAGLSHHMFYELALRDRPDILTYRYTWNDFHTMPNNYDLYMFLDFNPVLYRLHNMNYHPRIFYWWDSFHFSFTYPTQIVDIFDRAYFAEYQNAKILQSQGFQHVKWLPPAFYEKMYKKLDVPKVHDYSFIGQLDNTVIRYGLTRKEFIQKVIQLSGLHGYVGENVYGKMVNQIYNDAKVLFDRTIHWNIGTRFFETIGSGGFLLTNKPKIDNGVNEMATHGQHYANYDDSFQDFETKLRYYLEHEDERIKIAENGHRYFLQHHTYNHRLNTIFNDVGFTHI